VRELVEFVTEDTTICSELDLDAGDIAYKVKGLLLSVALGMTPGTLWDGNAKAQGGYIIVKEDGEVVCYHIYNRDQFEDYLFNNTKLDTPRPNRHGFGDIYSDEEKMILKLNFQIRFLA